MFADSQQGLDTLLTFVTGPHQHPLPLVVNSKKSSLQGPEAGRKEPSELVLHRRSVEDAVATDTVNRTGQWPCLPIAAYRRFLRYARPHYWRWLQAYVVHLQFR